MSCRGLFLAAGKHEVDLESQQALMIGDFQSTIKEPQTPLKEPQTPVKEPQTPLRASLGYSGPIRRYSMRFEATANPALHKGRARHQKTSGRCSATRPGYPNSQGFPMGPEWGPLPSLRGSEVWAPAWQVVYNGLIRSPLRGHTYWTMGSTLDKHPGSATRFGALGPKP